MVGLVAYGLIESQIIWFGKYDLIVELRMWNHERTELKAIMWSNFVHFNLISQKKEAHSDEIMDLFEKVLKTVESKTFEDRIRFLKSQKM